MSKSCIWCKSFQPKTLVFSHEGGFSLIVVGNQLLMDTGKRLIDIDIKYCPKCGRELKEIGE